MDELEVIKTDTRGRLTWFASLAIASLVHLAAGIALNAWYVIGGPANDRSVADNVDAIQIELMDPEIPVARAVSEHVGKMADDVLPAVSDIRQNGADLTQKAGEDAKQTPSDLGPSFDQASMSGPTTVLSVPLPQNLSGIPELLQPPVIPEEVPPPEVDLKAEENFDPSREDDHSLPVAEEASPLSVAQDIHLPQQLDSVPALLQTPTMPKQEEGVQVQVPSPDRPANIRDFRLPMAQVQTDPVASHDIPNFISQDPDKAVENPKPVKPAEVPTGLAQAQSSLSKAAAKSLAAPKSSPPKIDNRSKAAKKHVLKPSLDKPKRELAQAAASGQQVAGKSSGEKTKVSREKVKAGRAPDQSLSAPSKKGPSRTAEGAGGARGSKTKPEAGGVSASRWQGQVIAHIRRFRQYPSGTSATASVGVTFRINGKGVVKSVSVGRSSGDAVLDNAASKLFDAHLLCRFRLRRSPAQQ